MREIKFRGRRTLNGEWVYGNLMIKQADSPVPETSESCKCYYIVPIDGLDYCEHEVDPSTIGQYTGLKDKNGNDIYEGDIVKGVSHKFDSWSSKLIPFDVIGVVGYHKEYQTLEVSTGQQSSHIEVAVKGEVIGNIHDNPELLEEGGER